MAKIQRALVVDDSRFQRSIIKRHLAGVTDEWEVSEASNGEEALARIDAGERYDLITVDIHMPVMDGPATSWSAG